MVGENGRLPVLLGEHGGVRMIPDENGDVPILV
jgi:hypothetical protein